MAESLKNIVEALLFGASGPVTMGRLRQTLSDWSPEDIRSAIEEIGREYDENGRAFEIVEVGGGWQIMTRPAYGPWLKQMLEKRTEKSLSQPSLETLAIIAYKQPVLRADIENIRGVGCGDLIRNLMEIGLVRIAGRSDALGAPLLYGTTNYFLQFFGLRSIKELPTPEELEKRG